MKNILGIKFAYYRLAFNAFSLLTLIPVVIYQQLLSEGIIFSWPGSWNLLKFGMYLASFVLFYEGYRVFDMRSESRFAPPNCFFALCYAARRREMT
jgi:hypothetical protein